MRERDPSKSGLHHHDLYEITCREHGPILCETIEKDGIRGKAKRGSILVPGLHIGNLHGRRDHGRHRRRRQPERVHSETERVVRRRGVCLLGLLRVEVVAEEYLRACACRHGAAHARGEVRQANLVRGWSRESRRSGTNTTCRQGRRNAPFIQPKPSLGTILKSTPWLPYSASTKCESLTASNFSGTTPLKSTKAVVILQQVVRQGIGPWILTARTCTTTCTPNAGRPRGIRNARDRPKS